MLNHSQFETEADLVKAVVACVRQARRRTTAALEALSKIPPRLAVLLAEEVATSVRDRRSLAACLGTSDRQTKRIIDQCAAVGLIQENSGVLNLKALSIPPFERIIAVEAKLSQWKRVLVQAYRNLQFADESWVVIDHAHVRPVLENIDQFRLSGVGLISIARGQGMLVHLSANESGPMSLGKHWQAQAELARRVICQRTASSTLKD